MIVAALGILPLAGCNDINPYLGAAATQSSSIAFITPSSRPVGCSGFTLDVQGAGFISTAVVNWNNSPRATNFESSTELLATINASDLAAQTPVSIVVTTPALSGQQNQGNNLSNFVSFTIAAAVTQGNCPAPPTFPPTIQALSLPSGTAGTSLQIAGNFFGGVQNTSTVTFNGVAATVTSWSGTLLQVTVPTGTTGANTIVVTVNGVASVPLSPGENVFTVLPSGPASSALLASSAPQASSASASATRSFAITAGPRFVAFVAPSADPTADAGNGVDQIFLRDTCQGAPAGCSPGTTAVSVAFDGTQPNGASRSPSISASGRFVAFASDANNLVRGDANGVTDIFLRDTCIGAQQGCVPTTTRVSSGPDGIEANGPSASPSISSDGRLVAFDSVATNLVLDGQTSSTGLSEGAFVFDSCFGTASGCTPSLTRLSIAAPASR